MIPISSEVRFAVHDLYAEYAAALDDRRYDDWINLFDPDGSYTLQPRENADAGLPLATMRLESVGMIRDRIHALTETLYHAPYYQRHVISGLRLSDNAIGVSVSANYIVVRTHLDQPPELLSVGRCDDLLVENDGQWRFRTKRCVFDNELIANSIIYPV